MDILVTHVFQSVKPSTLSDVIILNTIKFVINIFFVFFFKFDQFLGPALEEYLVKSAVGSMYTCTICGKVCPDKSAGRNHLESKHIPSAGYNCEICSKFMHTKNALQIHMCRYHKNINS